MYSLLRCVSPASKSGLLETEFSNSWLKKPITPGLGHIDLLLCHLFLRPVNFATDLVPFVFRTIGRNFSCINLVMSTLMKLRSYNCVKWRPPKSDGLSCSNRVPLPKLYPLPWSLRAFMMYLSRTTHQVVVHPEQHISSELPQV